MRRQSRRDEARAAKRRFQARAQRAEIRRLLHKDDPSTAHDFACAFSCAECLTLTWPRSQAKAHPMRTEADVVVRPSHVCPSCGETAWVDLRSPIHAEALLAPLEAAQRRLRYARQHMLAVATLTMLYAGTLAGLWHAYGSDPVSETWLLTLLACGGNLLAWVVITTLRWLKVRRPPHGLRFGRAARRGRHVVSAPAEGDPTLHAPLSHEPCLAYRVTVRPRGSTTPWLDERRCQGTTVGGIEVTPDFGLDLGPQKETRELDPANAGSTRWLAERGLDGSRGDWVAEETILRPGDCVRVLERNDTLSLVATG